MHTLLVILLVLDALVMSAVVLLQAGQGGGLASLGGGGSDAYLGGRQAVTILTKASWWSGGIFLALSLVLSVSSSNRGLGATSDVQRLLQQQAQEAPAAAPGALPLGQEPEPASPAPSGTPAPQQ